MADSSDKPFRPAPVKPAVSFDVVASLDVRLGTIRAAANVEGSRKLVKLIVSFGDHDRQILAGLRQERPDISALVGLQALFIVNLEPRTMAGERSEGMLFDIGHADGLLPAFAMAERRLPDGARAG
jgi:tRNA-binding protein